MSKIEYLTFILFLLNKSWANAEIVDSTRSFIFTSAKSSSKSVARLSKKHTKTKNDHRTKINKNK